MCHGPARHTAPRCSQHRALRTHSPNREEIGRDRSRFEFFEVRRAVVRKPAQYEMTRLGMSRPSS